MVQTGGDALDEALLLLLLLLPELSYSLLRML